MTRPKINLVITGLLLVWTSIAQAATLTSSISRNPIKINQPVTLTLQYDTQVSTSALDLAPLTKDFEILSNRPSTNNSVSIINGTTTQVSTTTWSIVLAAKREGILTIPALRVNGDSSAPIKLQVSSLSAAEVAQPEPLEVGVYIDDVDNLSIRPGEQIIIRVELLAAEGVNNLRGGELKIAGADIEPLGQENLQRLDNGVARQLIIWRYAVFPKTAGKIIVPTQTFTANVGGRPSFFGNGFNGGKTVVAQSLEQAITIEPAPEPTDKPWFPANSVSIESSWSGDITNLRVGEPLTRTIVIKAQGQRASVIPPLAASNDHLGFKSYRDQAQLENVSSAQGITGVLSLAEAIVPSKSGQLTLAEHRVNWWDNSTDQWRETVLEAETITVLAPIGTAADSTMENTQNGLQASLPDTSVTPTSAQQRLIGTNWPWVLATLALGSLCLIQFYLLRKQKLPSPKLVDAEQTSNHSEKQAWQDLQHAFSRKDASSIRKTTIQWAQSMWPERQVNGLDTIALTAGSNELKAMLNQFDSAMYSNGEAPIFDDLNAQLAKLRQTVKKDAKRNLESSNPLPPLYPG